MEDIAEEVVQIAFMRIWEKRAGLSEAFPVEVQIAGTVRSIMIDILRKKAAERKALEVIKLKTNTITTVNSAEDKQLIVIQEAAFLISTSGWAGR